MICMMNQTLEQRDLHWPPLAPMYTLCLNCMPLPAHGVTDLHLNSSCLAAATKDRLLVPRDLKTARSYYWLHLW